MGFLPSYIDDVVVMAFLFIVISVGMDVFDAGAVGTTVFRVGTVRMVLVVLCSADSMDSLAAWTVSVGLAIDTDAVDSLAVIGNAIGGGFVGGSINVRLSDTIQPVGKVLPVSCGISVAAMSLMPGASRKVFLGLRISHDCSALADSSTSVDQRL